MNFLVTGGAGFIGSAVVRYLILQTRHKVLNLDKLTYAGNLQTLSKIEKSDRYRFIEGDICDSELIEKLFAEFQPDIVMHLAAESHVDRSIDRPSDFVQNNIVGTTVMLECARNYYSELNTERKNNFRFHHISTDEVFGSLGTTGLFSEESNYNPSSPYSASKASSDHLVRAWHRTYKLPVLITNCSNNYGPFQFPEKLIPLIILNAVEEKPLPIYGDGQQIRDWLYVEDHARALYKVVQNGKIGETYNIGGNNEKTNLEVVETICELLDELHPSKSHKIRSYKELITFVTDRPGHDQRYAIDASKIFHELNWKPEESFETGLRKTVIWFLKSHQWWKALADSGYQRERLGMEHKQ